MLDFNSPMLVNVKIESPVADFQTSGPVGWQDNINTNYLPPYPSDLGKVISDLVEILKDVGVVPYDNLSTMGSKQASVTLAHNLAIQTLEKEGMLSLQNGFVFNNVVYEDNIGIYNLHIVLKQRVDSKDTKTVMDAI